MIPCLGEPVKRGIRYTRRPGAYAILSRGGRILLTHQSRPSPEFQLPGGGIEAGEQVVPALRREIEEETGWRVGPLRKVGAFRRFTFMPEYDLWAEKICHVYFGRPALRLSAPKEEHHTAHWLPHRNAIALIANEGDRLFTQRILG